MNDSLSNEVIARLERFQEIVRGIDQKTKDTDLRRSVVREAVWVRQRVLENGCLNLYTFSPPPAVGGLVMENTDVFNYIFDTPYGMSVLPKICDMIDRTIAVIADPSVQIRKNISPTEKNSTEHAMRMNYAFIAMPIDYENVQVLDTHDAIKEACNRCGILAERIDEDQSNEQITARILRSIDIAEHIIADLSLERPNVFYEAGYALGRGKTPIYIARHGTKLHFDTKDFPIIFFESYKQLKDDLERRLRSLEAKKAIAN